LRICYLNKEAINQMNENIRKLNAQKSGKKKKPNKKNFTMKLPANIKIDKNRTASSSKGSFVQEFKKIRKEIESEIKREDHKIKSRVATAWTSPKNLANSRIIKRSNENLNIDNHPETEGKRKGIKKFIKRKKKKMKKEKILERSQELK